MTERTTGIENEPLEFQEEWLSAYLDGELTSEQRSVVEGRLQYDSNVQQMLLDLQKVRSLVAGLPSWPSAFGGLQDFQVPDKFDDAELGEPPPTADEMLLKSAASVEELEPLDEDTTFDAPQQLEMEEPASPPLKMQTSEEVLGIGRDTEAAGTSASDREETELANEHTEAPETAHPEIQDAAATLMENDSNLGDDSSETIEQEDDTESLYEDAETVSQDSELVAPVRESASYYSDDNKPSILPRLATAASLLAMLGLGYFLWEPIAGSLSLTLRPESSSAQDSLEDRLDENAVASRAESDEKLPVAPGAAITKKSEKAPGGEAADSSVDTAEFGMAGGGFPPTEPQSRLPALEQSRLRDPTDSAIAGNSLMDKAAVPPPSGGVPTMMETPKVQSRRIQTGGRGGRPSTRSIGGGGGGQPRERMQQASGGGTPAAPESAVPSMMKLQNGVAGESKVEPTESAAPVMEMAPVENLPDRQLSELESDEPRRFGGSLPQPPAGAAPAGLGGIAADTMGSQPATVAGMELSLLPQLHRQTKIPLGRYVVLSDGSWSLGEMRESLLRLKNRTAQTNAPEAAIGAYEGATERVLEKILEDSSYLQLSRSLVQRGRQLPPGEATSNDFSESGTTSGQPKKKRSSPAKPILLFTHRAAAEQLLQSKSISKATGQYLWVRTPNGQENPADKVLLLLNPK